MEKATTTTTTPALCTQDLARITVPHLEHSVGRCPMSEKGARLRRLLP